MAFFDLRNAPMGAKAPIFSDAFLRQSWPSIRAFDKVKSSPVRAVQPRVSEIILYWFCDRFYQMWNTFSAHFGYMFRSNLSFWVHLPHSGEVLGGWELKGSQNPWFWGPLGLPLDSLSHENAWPFLIKTCRICGWSLHALWLPKWIQMCATMELKLSLKWLLFRHRFPTVFLCFLGISLVIFRNAPPSIRLLFTTLS